jgi:S-adenosylmethionine decarboxylase
MATFVTTGEIETGNHLILELHRIKSEYLKDEEFIRNSMIKAAHASKATILHTYFHHFGNEYGVTGIIALSESHMSIHTWPEYNYAAVDIFLCGSADVNAAMESLLASLNCTNYNSNPLTRKTYRVNT